MKLTYLITFAILVANLYLAKAQTYQTLIGNVNFRSEAVEELIEANNNDVAAQLVLKSNTGQFIIPIKSFKFKKALLQEHFNENYMESDAYPKATYKYKITDLNHVDFNKNGKYKVSTTGILTIKNTAKTITVPGVIHVNNENSITLTADFDIQLSDYGIQIPKLVENKISKNIKIKVNSTLIK